MRAQLAATACEVPTKLLVRGWRGHRADRSGDIDIIPQEPDFVGTGGLPHSGPWDYVGQVPLLLYGPGHIQACGEVDRVVTLADIAPTQGELVDFPFDAPDGAPLSEALVPGADPPKVVVVVVWDGAGRFVLDEWPRSWPNLPGPDRRGHVVRGGRGGVVAPQHGTDSRDDRHRGVLPQPRARRPPAAHR